MNEKEMKEEVDHMRDSLIMTLKGFNILGYWIILLSFVAIFWIYAIYAMIAGAIIILIYSHRIRKGILKKQEEESEKYRMEVELNE